MKRVRKPTDRQVRALYFICDVLDLEFPGDINNEHDVSMWLKWYFVKAKETERKAHDVNIADNTFDYVADYSDVVGCEV